MKVRYENSFYIKALARVRGLPFTSILRADFSDLGSERQISRALKKLIEKKIIVRLGYGVYARLTSSQYKAGSTYLESGFLPTVREALTHLNVDWEPSQFEKDYNSGRSTQISARPSTKINARFSRKLAYNDFKLRIE